MQLDWLEIGISIMSLVKRPFDEENELSLLLTLINTIIYIFDELLALYDIPSKSVILQNSNGASGACFF